MVQILQSSRCSAPSFLRVHGSSRSSSSVRPRRCTGARSRPGPECLSSGVEEGMGWGEAPTAFVRSPLALCADADTQKLIKAAGQQLDAAAPPGFRELWANWVTMPWRSTAPRPQCLMGARGKRLPLTGDDFLLVDGFRCLQNFHFLVGFFFICFFFRNFRVQKGPKVQRFSDV